MKRPSQASGSPAVEPPWIAHHPRSARFQQPEPFSASSAQLPSLWRDPTSASAPIPAASAAGEPSEKPLEPSRKSTKSTSSNCAPK